MKSQTSLVARKCRIQEWAAMVQECQNRPIGMSVSEWCQANNITKANYYYRFTQVRKSCLESVPTETLERAIVPVPTELMQAESELSVPVASVSAPHKIESFLEINVHGVSIRVNEQTSSSLLKNVLEVLAYVK